MSENDLKHIFDEDVKEKLIGNPLKRFLRQLGSLYIQRSQQELNRTAQKEKVARKIREQRRLTVILKPVEPAVSQPSSEHHSTANVYPRYPSTLPSTPQKRNASEASLDLIQLMRRQKNLSKPKQSFKIYKTYWFWTYLMDCSMILEWRSGGPEGGR